MWRLATAQHGLVLREQLLLAGFTRGAIEHRIAVGELGVVHRGVYLVGHAAPAPFVYEMAAALYYRGHALISHRSAAAIWGLIPEPPTEVQLTIVGRDCRSRAGLRLSRTQNLDPRDFRWRAGLPVTAPARTLIDLSADATQPELEHSLAEARILKLVSRRELLAALARAPRRAGAGRLRALLEAEGDQGFTRSAAERRLLELITRAQLPRPEVNVRLCGYEVDALWREAKLVVEIDGHAFHGHRAAFERDRKRDQILAAAGYRVVRVTWRQLVQEPLAVAVRLAQALAR
jgi:very-short-patch-repair endonuclease